MDSRAERAGSGHRILRDQFPRAKVSSMDSSRWMVLFRLAKGRIAPLLRGIDKRCLLRTVIRGASALGNGRWLGEHFLKVDGGADGGMWPWQIDRRRVLLSCAVCCGSWSPIIIIAQAADQLDDVQLVPAEQEAKACSPRATCRNQETKPGTAATPVVTVVPENALLFLLGRRTVVARRGAA